jgi:hypothetical protein
VKFTQEEMAYDVPAELDPSSWVPVIGQPHASELRGGKPLKATYAVVDDDAVRFSLEDGRRVSAPLDWYPRLKHGTSAERNDWRLIGSGRAVLWERLGLAIAVNALLDGTKANESPAELKKWLDGRKAKALKKTA